MSTKFIVFIALSVAISVPSSAVPKHDRVLQSKLSEKEPGSKDYDHEAFLGHNAADEFDQLSEEESKRRLGIIFDKIDANSDTLVSQKELEDWITKAQKSYVQDDTEREFETHDLDKDGVVSWEEYYNVSFGFLTEQDWESNTNGFSYKDMLKRDKTRFEAADLNKDNQCTVEEYKSYMHPEEYDHMKPVVLAETMKDMDKDGDGFINMDEYIGDLYKPDADDEKEPDWVAQEKEQFVKYRDEDKDGKLNFEELKKWILPEDYNHAVAESTHLVFSSDDDKDGFISKEEMVDHHDMFVGSQATEWGELLNNKWDHDEF